MGNCCGTTSSSVHYWGGDDWSFLTSNKSNRNRNKSSTKVFDELKLMNNKDNKRLVGDLSASANSSSSSIKIKISKKELQVLLGEFEKQKKNKSNSAEQVLVRLMEARHKHHHRTGHNNWSPVLESIPEVN